jgi:hypothetical protein
MPFIGGADLLPTPPVAYAFGVSPHSRRARAIVEEQAVRESGAPAGGELPVLALDVVDDGRARPSHEGRDDEADALAGAGGSHGQDVLGPSWRR